MANITSRRNTIYRHPGLKQFSAFVRRTLLLFTLAVYHTAAGQLCSKKTAIYFETNRSEIVSAGYKKLDSLAMAFTHKKDTFLLEANAHADSTGSYDYNYKLSKDRLTAVLSYLNRRSKCHFEITDQVMGENAPANTNLTEEGRSKNRRIDIFVWPVKNGRIALKGSRGTEIVVDKDYFGPCGVCESNPKITETFTNEEATRQGIPLTTTDEEQLITGGMMSLDFSCGQKSAKKESRPAGEVVIRIPAESFDERMELWSATSEKDPRKTRWYRDKDSEFEYDAKNKCYVIRIRSVPGKPIRKNLDCLHDMTRRGDAGTNTPTPQGIVTIPELNRTTRKPYVSLHDTSKAADPEKKLSRAKMKTIKTFTYSKKTLVFFVDSGISKDKIGYTFSGNINNFEIQCDTAKCSKEDQCWCFEVPIEAYRKIIYFQKDKEFRLKVPKKYSKYPLRLFIPAADTTIAPTKIEGTANKYAFRQPLPETEIVLYDQNGNLNNPKGFVAQIKFSDLRTKYSKRKKYYKANIKRKQLKKALENKNSGT